ncbi:hypothetical protein [Streptomyces sp. RFCAC02]|uniref:hypothetical protein n=1 Tax=Streptomyces sp. RFCAC02 TaxID=2499143 RepID=UPI00101E8C59|nr:hypothetical protein [Streptomyces sp. RFCAC02]
MTPDELSAVSPGFLFITGLACAGLLAAVVMVAHRRRRSRASASNQSSPAVRVAALAAICCTAYSADTSWNFAADRLQMARVAERAAMFATAELALFACALLARQHLSTRGSTGLPGALVWLITTVQIIPAYAESGPVGGTVRAVIGPIMAATLWHQAMGIELRIRRPDAESGSLLATLGREVRERMLARLGVERGRDAEQIARDRATARAVALATRLAEHSPRWRTSRRGRRVAGRLASALARSGVSTDPEQRDRLLRTLADRRHALALATMELPVPWEPPTGDGPHTVPERQSRRTVPRKEHVPRPRPAGTETGAGTGTRSGTGTAAWDSPQGTAGQRGSELRPAGTSPAQCGNREADPEVERPPGRDRHRPAPPRGRPKNARDRTRTARPLTTEQLVERVRPHVPAVLERDGNETLNRDQLREILRTHGLPGRRNEHLAPVLERLREHRPTSPEGSSR